MNLSSKKKQLDFSVLKNAAEQEWSHVRNLQDAQELVEYRDHSCIRIWYNTENTCYSAHWHSAIEIIMPIENSYQVQIKDSDYLLNPDDILLIPPGDMHTLTAPSSGSRFIILMDISKLLSLPGFSGIQAMLLRPIHITKDSHPSDYEEISSLMFQLCNEYFRNEEYCELSIYSLFLRLSVCLGRTHLQSTPLSGEHIARRQIDYHNKFSSVLSYIDSHCTEPLTLNETAKAAGFSKYHFTRLFKQYTSTTFCDYVNYRRIKLAEEHLAHSELSITEIALSSGFSSISSFNRVFRQLKGCSPSDYRAIYHVTYESEPSRSKSLRII